MIEMDLMSFVGAIKAVVLMTARKRATDPPDAFMYQGFRGRSGWSLRVIWAYEYAPMRNEMPINQEPK